MDHGIGGNGLAMIAGNHKDEGNNRTIIKIAARDIETT